MNILALFRNKKSTLISTVCLLVASLSLLFPAGSLKSSVAIERTSEYIADIAQNDTKSGKYVSLMIEPNDSTDEKIRNSYYEFHSLYAVFREGLATYVGTANADKSENTIRIKGSSDETNFSFLNVDSGFGVKEYYKDEEGNMVYKQEFYPLELMFYSNHPMIPEAFSFLYISKSRATEILDEKKLEHTRENYHSLLNQLITLEINGVDYVFAIDNIYLEQNYFYDALNETIGEFFLGGQKYPPEIKRQAMFFLRNYAYQNKYFIEYASSIYPEKDFNYKLLDYNFTNEIRIDENRLVFSATPKADAAAIMITFLSALLLLLAIAFVALGSFDFSIMNHLLVFGSLFLPYVIFWFTHFFTKDPLLFSNYSTTCSIWFMLVFIGCYLILFLIKIGREKKHEKTN